MTTRREQAYGRKIRDLIDRAGKLDDAAVKRAGEILEQSRREIAARIAETEWDQYYIPQMKEAVERAMDGFRQRFGTNQEAHASNVWNAGIDQVDGPLHFVGLGYALPELPRTLLSILQGYSADLVKGLSADAMKRVTNEITLGVMGQKPQFEVMKAIGRNLSDPGVFRTIFSRAETITRTESARVQSAAREARQEQTVKGSPGEEWEKKWISSGKAHPRANHAALDGVVVPFDEDFPGGIPYPHAPGLPAEESVNCG